MNKQTKKVSSKQSVKDDETKKVFLHKLQKLTKEGEELNIQFFEDWIINKCEEVALEGSDRFIIGADLMKEQEPYRNMDEVVGNNKLFLYLSNDNNLKKMSKKIGIPITETHNGFYMVSWSEKDED